MPKNCPNCHTQNIDGARFCRQCGTVLQETRPDFKTQVDTSPIREMIPPISTPDISPLPDYGPIFQQPYTPVPTAPLAGFWIRFLAYFLDGIIPSVLLAIGYAFLVGSGINNEGPSFEGSMAFLGCALGALIFVLFNTYLQGKNGATIGKSMAGLRCLGNDGLPLGFGKSFLRELVKHLIAQSCVIFLFIDNLWMLSDPEKQTLHDKVANSHVYKI